MNARSIPCPRCKAGVGEPCYYDRHKLKLGDPMPEGMEHQKRLQAVAQREAA